jgi:cell fate (sporulation/competence/biofilm development) regulator YlbF (YheA/YmcA/DUF963 family)
MSIESTPEGDAEPPAVRATKLASELGEAIASLPSYEAFIEAKTAVEESEDAQVKIREFEQLRESFMLARQTGDATGEDLQRLQEAQQELHDIPEMRTYLERQSAIELELQELNKTISAPLAIDFGEKAGGCCQD